MEIKDLSQQALRVRQLYAELERKEYGHLWTSLSSTSNRAFKSR